MNNDERCCEETDIKFDLDEIEKVHYIGNFVFDTDSKQKVRSIIEKVKIIGVANGVL